MANGKVKEALDAILECFESGRIPEAVAYSVFPVPDLPSSKWSFLNRINIFIAGTADARGFRQWKEVGRHVKKGSKAIYILVPRIIKRENLNEKGEKEEGVTLAGFMARPVFRMEDTEGEPLDYQQIQLPPLPLIEKAKKWGICVKAIPGDHRYYGYFCQSKQEIGLATKEESVFFHELAHASHQRLAVEFEKLPSWEKEVVAELSAAALCRIVGKSTEHLGNSYRYIRHYAAEAKSSPVSACLQVLSQVEEVLNLILADAKLPLDEVLDLLPATEIACLNQAAPGGARDQWQRSRCPHDHLHGIPSMILVRQS
jgi:hypothetical protein